MCIRDSHTPERIASSIAIEAAELLEVFQWLSGEEISQRLESDGGFREQLRDEIADVVLYVCSLSNAADIDISSAVINKLEKNRLKYPSDTYSQLTAWPGRVS